ncbi:uncharacterized protein LOC130840935 isoform X2 [Hippopotamus amphibius kiboko]|uniref:uncharacterized protein LOC130840935 isoform X2 n=1 Tax=Hippopotamus amphibius kiboko TaxID=575201 RepID=UPI0025937595|nr:uncharacterized protein LOC130840935 isoform X2 [Hippopotamus amphibius kiboko]
MDGVKTLKGGIVDVHKLDTVLQNMGMKLTKTESKDLIKNLPVDGGMVKVNNLDNVLENLGIELTEKEQEDLIENLPLDVHGNVDLDKLLDGVKALTGREINVSDVEYVLENMGIELTGKEWLKLLKNLPIDDGKIYQNRLMDGMTSLRGDGKVHKNRILKGVKSFKRGKVDSSNLKPLLEKMDLKLTEKEFEELKENLSVDGMHSRYPCQSPKEVLSKSYS